MNTGAKGTAEAINEYGRKLKDIANQLLERNTATRTLAQIKKIKRKNPYLSFVCCPFCKSREGVWVVYRLENGVMCGRVVKFGDYLDRSIAPFISTVPEAEPGVSCLVCHKSIDSSLRINLLVLRQTMKRNLRNFLLDWALHLKP